MLSYFSKDNIISQMIVVILLVLMYYITNVIALSYNMPVVQGSILTQPAIYVGYALLASVALFMINFIRNVITHNTTWKI